PAHDPQLALAAIGLVQRLFSFHPSIRQSRLPLLQQMGISQPLPPLQGMAFVRTFHKYHHPRAILSSPCDMTVELKVPEVGESITEVHIGQWRKQVGQAAGKDESLVEIESDKATVDLPSPIAGTLTQILKQQGEKALVGEVIGYMSDGADAKPAA